jgi:hypothetical protein
MTYEAFRDTRLSGAEGLRKFVYADTREIPTTSRGVALIAHDGSKWAVVANLADIGREMGLTTSSIKNCAVI